MKEFLESTKDGVFFIGHASALARINGRLILFDPVWNHKPYGDYWEFIPKQIDLDFLLDKIDYCVVSHIHEDHVCKPILRKLRCPILIMSGRPQLKNRLKRNGKIVATYDPFEWISIGDNLEIYFVPHDYNTIDSSCFVRSKEFCFYHGNDNFLSQRLLEKIKPDVGQVDVAMIPYAFIHWYPFLMEMPIEEKQKEIARLNQQSLNQARIFVDVINPKQIIPSGASLFHVENEYLNENLADPSDIGLTLMHAGTYIIGNQTIVTIGGGVCDISIISKKVSAAMFTVKDHILGVNGLFINLEKLTVSGSQCLNGKTHVTIFNFKEVEFKKWLDGEITFEQAIGTRQFTCKREPNVYNPKVFDWMNNFL